MEKNQDQKHICKFCSKRFPCGRSLGGHMRSHLINIPPSDHQKNDEKPPKKKKKLPPLSIDQSSHSLAENPKKKSKFSKDALLQDTNKACKECGKRFQSWKALFGHMKCHSTNIARIFTNSFDEDSWNSSTDHHHHKPIMDSQSDNEAATPSNSCKRKRSDRIKRYKSAATNSSSSLTIANLSPSVSEGDHHEQEEVALSLIILSRDKGDWGGLNSVVESSDNYPLTKTVTPDSKSDQCLKNIKKVKKLDIKRQSPPRIEAKTRKLDALNNEAEIEFEVNSPKNVIKNQFERERKKSNNNSSRERNSPLCQEPEQSSSSSKFSCSICKKAFPSYQALGGHRASHKKFKGCCAPRRENSLETENSHNQSENLSELVGFKKSKEHECPICFKVFPSGQALGGHKRSHLIINQANNNNNDDNDNDNALPQTERALPEIRGFLDLNLPAPPEEEECNDFKPWWIKAGRHQQRPPLLGLLSTS